MANKLLKDISASTIQVILNQVMGVIIFLITSRYLSKEIYGEFNWSLAVLTFATTILSLRLEQIIVRKVAAGENASNALTSFTFHIITSGILFYGLLLVFKYSFPLFFTKHNLLLLLAISQLLSFFSLPFKQVANGKEKFGHLAIMSTILNMARSLLLASVVVYSFLTIEAVILIFIISSGLELVASVFIVQKVLKINFDRKWEIKNYKVLIAQSLPQIGSVFLNACIARADWILLGLMSTPSKMAEYSFAYKVFELSPIPMIVLAPILLSKFSIYFSNKTEEDLLRKSETISLIIRFQMVMATFIPLLINVVWSPVVDSLTYNKYGSVNQLNFLLLSCCIPFQYLINFFWTLHFAQNRLKKIFTITAVSCSIIIAGNLLLIPLLNTTGSAIVYLTTMMVEFILLFLASSLRKLNSIRNALFVSILSAFTSGLVSFMLINNIILKLAVATSLYLFLMLLFNQIRKSDFKLIKILLVGKLKKSVT